MKSRDSLLKLKRFQAEEKLRRVTQIEAMIADFDKRADELEEQIEAEQRRAGIYDTGHFAYPTFAKAAAQRRDNLRTSAAELRVQCDAAKLEHDTALEELQKLEAVADRDASAGHEAASTRAG